jgi:hypothetical protein
LSGIDQYLDKPTGQPVDSDSSLRSLAVVESLGDISDDESDLNLHKEIDGKQTTDMNWNEEFQKILLMPYTSKWQSIERFSRMDLLIRQFGTRASEIAVRIIQDVHLPNSQKFYKPQSVGGIAGGEKYIVQGIFFKLAKDWHKIYGGDEFAMKAASLEMKGARAYLTSGVDGLHIPFMVNLDYLGFRVTASTLLPLAPNSLV